MYKILDTDNTDYSEGTLTFLILDAATLIVTPIGWNIRSTRNLNHGQSSRRVKNEIACTQHIQPHMKITDGVKLF